MPTATPPPAVTLSQAKELVRCLADTESLLLLSPPGVGKSAAVEQAARDAGLVVRSLLGTQIAPEDVSGVPKLVNNRAVFCPPRLLLPDDDKPFCLFLDELPAAPPDVQKAFYSLLLERRVGEYRLPKGTWVVAAGNRSEDRALVRTMSSALVNRVFVLPVRVDPAEWFAWAEAAGVRPEIRGFVRFVPSALQRPVPPDPVPFSTPRSWAMLSRDLDLAEAGGRLNNEERRALAFGRVTPHDAGLFCALCEEGLGDMRPVPEYFDDPGLLPKTETAMWFLVSRTRNAVGTGELAGTPAEKVNAFLTAVGEEYRFALLLDLVEKWAELGASQLMLATLKTVTGLESAGERPEQPTMTPDPQQPSPEQVALANAARALKLVSANLPHLSGLCHSVRLKVSRKYPVAAIGATGLMVVNPRVFSETPLPDLVFVVAHELMHLALDTFGRAGGADPYLVNVAHDYVINDILSVELGRPVPLGGLVRHGARQESLEALVTELARNGTGGNPSGCWSVERKKKPKKPRPPKNALSDALRKALEKAGKPLPDDEPEPEEEPEPDYPGGDTLSGDEEAELEPHMGPKERGAVRERVRREAVRAVSLKELRDQIEKHSGGGHGQGADGGATQTLMDAVATAYQPPWQLALQHWLDAITPGPRSFARPSRRGADRADGVILPGRKREGWALHVVMDTSGSMVSTLPKILGLLASFCEGAGVNQVHILQCDVGVTADEWLDPAELAAYKITGFGGSDMSPAMDELALDPEVNAVLVLTDGYISYPADEPPYAVLWGLVDGYSGFHPPYGTVVHVKT